MDGMTFWMLSLRLLVPCVVLELRHKAFLFI